MRLDASAVLRHALDRTAGKDNCIRDRGPQRLVDARPNSGSPGPLDPADTAPLRSSRRSQVQGTPIAGFISAPARRITANSSLERPRPAPRPERSPADFSNTATSQPISRNRQAANSPPTEPPITNARGTIRVPASCGAHLARTRQRAKIGLEPGRLQQGNASNGMGLRGQFARQQWRRADVALGSD